MAPWHYLKPAQRDFPVWRRAQRGGTPGLGRLFSPLFKQVISDTNISTTRGCQTSLRRETAMTFPLR